MKAYLKALATLLAIAGLGWGGLYVWKQDHDTGAVRQASYDYERVVRWCKTGHVFVIEETRYVCREVKTP